MPITMGNIDQQIDLNAAAMGGAGDGTTFLTEARTKHSVQKPATAEGEIQVLPTNDDKQNAQPMSKED